MIRIKSFSIYLSSLVLLVSSCSRDVNTEDPNLSDPLTEVSPETEGAEVYQRSSSEAIAIAKSFLGATEDLRSIDDVQLSLDFVAPSSKRKLRATDGSSVTPVDTPLFIINVPNEGGFFLVSGDTRMPDLLAAVEHGNLDKNNVDANTGLAVFLSRLPIYYENRLKAGKGPIPGDHIDDPDHYGDWENYNLVYGEWQTSLDVKPLIKTHWHQGSPFNDQAPLINGDTAYAGCVNIAFAQLIAFHRKPDTFRGLTIDWELLTNTTKANQEPNRFKTMVASLCRKIGDATNTTWGTWKHGKGSSAYEKMIPKVLSKEMGYSEPSSVLVFDKIGNSISRSISHSCPVVLSGMRDPYDAGWWIFKWEAYESGHTWLVDGLFEQYRIISIYKKKTGKLISTKDEHRTFLHCNWGWGQEYDGYYEEGVFDSRHPAIKDDPNNFQENGGYYKYEITYIPFIKP